MDQFFELQDAIIKLHQNLTKHSDYRSSTRKAKIHQLIKLKEELKEIIKKRTINQETRLILIKRYKILRIKVKEGIAILKGKTLEDTTFHEAEDEEEKLEEDQENDNDTEEDENEEEEDEVDTNSDFETDTEEEMAPKLDLGLAMKIVKPFDGSAVDLLGYIESVELLKDYAEGVPEADLIKFLKITLTGSARGAIDEVRTIDAAKTALKNKFGVKLTPKAVESEMLSKRQGNKNLTDFGDETNKLATKLAAAYVSQGTFASEAAASNLVETVAVRAFTDGLRDQTTQFLLKARNPNSLNKAISDALECGSGASKNSETALWCSFRQQQSNNYNNYRGRGYHRGSSYTWRGDGGRGSFRARGGYRGRGNYQQNNGNQGNYRGRGNYQQYQNRQHNNENQHNNNNRNRQNNAHANVAEQNNNRPQRNNEEEEVNVVAELFRE